MGRPQQTGSGSTRAAWHPSSSRSPRLASTSSWLRTTARAGPPSRRSGRSSRSGGPWQTPTSRQPKAAQDRADRIRREVNERFLVASRDDDFVGIQTYGRTVFGPDGVTPAPEGAATNQMGEEIYPEALEATIREAASVAGIPVIVTENGLATDDDSQRLAYLSTAVAGVASAWPTASTSAATSPGQPSTTSSGSLATVRSLASSRWTGPRRNGPRRRAPSSSAALPGRG